MSWRIAGTYFESCNCDPICPCRRIDGVPGGRSTYGECFGVLTWAIEDGAAEEVSLSGCKVGLASRYHDDEPGSPWSFVLHVDERGDEGQRDALAKILLGELGGDDVLRLPWIRKPSNLLDVRTSPIEIVHEPGGYALRVGAAVALAAEGPVEDDSVRCGIPGYHQPGTELYADSFVVEDDPFAWELAGNCAFASRFDYAAR